jgi:predicted ABC-type transport system involved in lysophospholipase L1 biosynthesis ATPase subunit
VSQHRTLICIFAGYKKKRTSVVVAGTIVVDVKKPAKIILRNHIIFISFRSFSVSGSLSSMKCGEKEKKEQKKKQSLI